MIIIIIAMLVTCKQTDSLKHSKSEITLNALIIFGLSEESLGDDNTDKTVLNLPKRNSQDTPLRLIPDLKFKKILRNILVSIVTRHS